MATRVLFADHSPAFQQMAAQAFAHQKIEVIRVGNGDIATWAINQVKPDLVFADVSLPDRDGYELCRYIKGNAPLSHIPVVLLTLTSARPDPTLSTDMDVKIFDKVNPTEKLRLFDDYWSPKIVGELNDSHVKLVKLKGEFVWHRHEAEDELFLVVKGRLLIKLRDRDVELEEGEFIIIPRGVEHLPVAEQEVHVLLLEPKSTLNTGNVTNERTVESLERI
jgi:mannose-6-phosphate isomerase-like protein (cupin superfamily)